ncbi:MAG: amidohydrolase [Gammaproteobacteria bacterium]|nr:amidohydrolase [Gammaproteobacteria bacterium]
MELRTRTLTRLLQIILLGYASQVVAWDDIYFVDAHSQFDANVTHDIMLDRMVNNQVKATILATRGPSALNERQKSLFDFTQLAAGSSVEILPALRSKSSLYFDGTDSEADVLAYKDFLEKQLIYPNNNGYSIPYRATGEVLNYHQSKSEDIPLVIKSLFSPYVQETLNIAKNKNWPFIVHLEFGAMTKEEFLHYRDELEKLLDDNPTHNFILIHMAQLDLAQTLRMLMRHDNVYFLTSHADPLAAATIFPWTNLFEPDGNGGYRLQRPWQNAFNHHSDRFIFALDNVFVVHWQNQYNEKIKYWRTALSQLKYQAAHNIAHCNAERLWNISSEYSCN